jgi:hypothetical protein
MSDDPVTCTATWSATILDTNLKIYIQPTKCTSISYDVFNSQYSDQHVSAGIPAGRLEGHVLITRTRLWLTVSPSLHDNNN